MFESGDPFSNGRCNTCWSKLYEYICFECDVQCINCGNYMQPDEAKLDRNDESWCGKCYANELMKLEDVL